MMLGVMWMMTAVVVGFMLGRASMYGQMGVLETAQGPEADMAGAGTAETDGEEGRLFGHRKRTQREERAFWAVGSPVSGPVTAQLEGERPVAVIYPEGDFLYAPVAGKVTKLFPMGNAFLLTADFGAELYVQVGDGSDELLGRYYRPRVVQNEFVGKGKLLLEFDRKGLEAEGASPEVEVCVENCCYGGDVEMTAGESAKIGEEILRVLA